MGQAFRKLFDTFFGNSEMRVHKLTHFFFFFFLIFYKHLGHDNLMCIRAHFLLIIVRVVCLRIS